jgi:hypothetical protein
MSTSDLITKIDLYFNDGSVKTLVGQDRFLGIRDALKTQSQANELLCKQAELLEERIRELESKCQTLEDLSQELISQLNTDASFVPDSHFKNPLP